MKRLIKLISLTILLLCFGTFTLRFWTGYNDIKYVSPISGNLIQYNNGGRNINNQSQPNTDIKVTVDANYSSKYIVNMPKAVIKYMSSTSYFWVPSFNNHVNFTTAILNSANGSSIVPLLNEIVGTVNQFAINLPTSSMGSYDMVTIYSVTL